MGLLWSKVRFHQINVIIRSSTDDWKIDRENLSCLPQGLNFAKAQVLDRLNPESHCSGNLHSVLPVSVED